MKQQRTKCVYNQHQKRYRVPAIIHDEMFVTAAQFKQFEKYVMEIDKRITDVNMAAGDKLWITWKGVMSGVRAEDSNVLTLDMLDKAKKVMLDDYDKR